MAREYTRMPKPRAQLPDSFATRPFTVAEAREAGVSHTVLTHARFASPFYGVRVPGNVHEHIPLEECFAQALREGEAFSHTTALRLFGCPIRCGEAIHLTVPEHRRARRAAGVIGHSTRREFSAIALSGGIRVVPPTLALVQSAPLLPLPELIVALDHLIGRHTREFRLGYGITVSEIEELTRRPHAAGARNLRAALRHARVGAESRMETLLRLLLVAYGFAHHFEAQVEIFDEAGKIGRFDLVCGRLKLILEYDGEQHRVDRSQYLKDELRLERVRAAGYRVIRLHAEDVVGNGRRDAVRRVAEAVGHTGPVVLVAPELI